MKKILFSLGMIVALTGAVIGGTSAFFSDTETAAGNVFQAGAIDLKVDNESYYNGAVSTSTSFGPSDLDEGKLFLNFTDLKPDDEGEDTISLHVNNNDAWLCMDMSLTSNDDVSSNEPELGAGDVPNTDDAWDGELSDLVQMAWWVDDGDNVYEVGESLLNGTATTVKAFFGPDKLFSADLADATTNVWTNQPGPVVGSQTYYIGKAWCFGTMTLAPVTQDASTTDGPLAPGRVATGYTCNGTALGNQSQSDAVTMNIGFRAEQARHNESFTCSDERPTLATITVTKTVVNDNGGNNPVGSFQLFVGATPVSSGVSVNILPGTYEVSELGAAGYEATFGGDCDVDGNITLVAGGTYNCSITNDDIRPNITLQKIVVGGTAVATDFKMRVNGVLVPSGGSRSVNSNTNVTITEDAFPGYTPTSITGVGCPASLGAPFQLNEGVAITCTITNTFNAI